MSRVRREARRWRRINLRALATNRGEEVVDNLVLLDGPEYGKKTVRTIETGKQCKKGRYCLFSSGRRPSHAVKEDLLERADPTLLDEAAELGDRYPFVFTVWKSTS